MGQLLGQLRRRESRGERTGVGHLGVPRGRGRRRRVGRGRIRVARHLCTYVSELTEAAFLPLTSWHTDAFSAAVLRRFRNAFYRPPLYPLGTISQQKPARGQLTGTKSNCLAQLLPCSHLIKLEYFGEQVWRLCDVLIPHGLRLVVGEILDSRPTQDERLLEQIIYCSVPSRRCADIYQLPTGVRQPIPTRALRPSPRRNKTLCVWVSFSLPPRESLPNCEKKQWREDAHTCKLMNPNRSTAQLE